MSSLTNRADVLRNLSGPIHLSEELPPFWIKREGKRAQALFENPSDFEKFERYFPFFSGFDYVEVDAFGTVRVHMGYVQ